MSSVLLRCCTYYIVVLADIKKVFLLNWNENKKWLNDPKKLQKVEGNLCTHHFCIVSLGIFSSPFLLEATLRHQKSLISLTRFLIICTVC